MQLSLLPFWPLMNISQDIGHAVTEAYSLYLAVLINCLLFSESNTRKTPWGLVYPKRNLKSVFMNDGLERPLVVLIAVNKLFWSDGYGMDRLWLSDVLWELSEFSHMMSFIDYEKKAFWVIITPLCQLCYYKSVEIRLV